MENEHLPEDLCNILHDLVDGSKIKSCALCGEKGHNRRTCPERSSRNIVRSSKIMHQYMSFPIVGSLASRVRTAAGISVSRRSCYYDLSSFDDNEEGMQSFLATCRGDHDVSEVVEDGSSIPFTWKDLETLLPGTWLNDEVINAYMNLLRNSVAGNKIFIAFTYFFSKLMEGDAYDYGRIASYHRRDDWHSKQLLLFPVRKGWTHWFAIRVNVSTKTITVYDSLCRSRDWKEGHLEYCTRLRSYLINKIESDETKPTTWTVELHDETPQQSILVGDEDVMREEAHWRMQIMRDLIRGRI